MNHNPFFSVITVCFNAEKTLEKTLISVSRQRFRDFEYIVIDGNSTDGTLSILKKFTHQIDVLVSEPDKGIYDAMNKGISLAHGKYIYFLNADDHFASDSSLEDVKRTIRSNPDIVSCNMITFGDFGENKENLPPLNVFNILRGFFAHPATFVKRSVFKEIGMFNTNIQITADLEWILRAFTTRRYTYQKLDCYCTKFFLGGISANSAPKMLKEQNRIKDIHKLNGRIPSFFLRLEKLSRGILKFLHTTQLFSVFASKCILLSIKK